MFSSRSCLTIESRQSRSRRPGWARRMPRMSSVLRSVAPCRSQSSLLMTVSSGIDVFNDPIGFTHPEKSLIGQA